VKRLSESSIHYAKPLPEGATHVVVSQNPKAGSRSAQHRVDRLVERLTAAGLDVEVHTDLNTVEQRVAESHAVGRLRALVGVGGDGTAAELVNRTAEGVPLAMLPSGNENLLARYLGWAKDPDRLAESLLHGRVVRVDAAAANGRIFLIMAGCGFDGEVVSRVHARRTGHIRTSHYFKPIADVVRNYRYPLLQCALTGTERAPADSTPAHSASEEGRSADEPEQTIAGRWLFVFNFPCYGGSLPIAPYADPTDGRLDLVALERGSMWHALRYATGVYLRRHQHIRDMTTCRVQSVTIAPPEGEQVAYQLDGDPGGTLPVTITTLPERLTLILPAATT